MGQICQVLRLIPGHINFSNSNNRFFFINELSNFDRFLGNFGFDAGIYNRVSWERRLRVWLFPEEDSFLFSA